MCSAQKLNKESNNIQPCILFSFPTFETVHRSTSRSNCYSFLTLIQVSQETSKGVWYSYLFKNFPQFLAIHLVKGFSIINEAEVDVFLELPCLLHHPKRIGNLIIGSSASSKSSLYIWKFLVHILLKPSCCSIIKSCLTLCNSMNYSTTSFSVLHYLPEFAQIHGHWVSDANYLILCHPLLL